MTKQISLKTPQYNEIFGREAYMIETPNDFAPRKLTRHQARMEHLLYWSSKTIPERLAAAGALTRRLYQMRVIGIDQFKTDLTPGRVRRSKS